MSQEQAQDRDQTSEVRSKKSVSLLPPGAGDPVLLSREQAAQMFGVSVDMWKRWQAAGRVTCGKWIPSPPGVSGRRRVFPLEDLLRLKDELRGQGLLYGATPAGDSKLPEGFVDRDEAARILGIVPKTLALFFTDGRVTCGKWWKLPGGKRRKIYPIAELKREIEKMEAARPTIPEGFVDVDGACRMFGVTKAAWVIWKRQGKVPRGKWWRSPNNMPCRIYAVEKLIQLNDELRGDDKAYMKSTGEYHIPAGWMRIQDACKLFGVNYKTWNRWEAEGLIVCGKRFMKRGLKLYPVDEVHRLLAECGKYSPPYPDPDRPGVHRIPLAGQEMHRREAIIDAADVPLVEGKRFHYSGGRGADDRAAVCTFNRSGHTRLRQIIMGVSESDGVIGHLNGDPLDCRRANLVVRTRSESSASSRKAKTFCGRPCTSRFKGVCWSESKGKWLAYVKKDGVMQNLSHFDDELAAAQARDEAMKELFGEHARLNFPDGIDACLEQEAEALQAEAAETKQREAA